MAEIFGYTATEMIETLPVLGIIAPRERYLVAELVKASLGRKDGTVRYERRGRKKDGTQIDIEVFSRSEEHTSELQSLMRISYAVFCLKKKKKQEANT